MDQLLLYAFLEILHFLLQGSFFKKFPNIVILPLFVFEEGKKSQHPVLGPRPHLEAGNVD